MSGVSVPTPRRTPKSSIRLKKLGAPAAEYRFLDAKTPAGYHREETQVFDPMIVTPDWLDDEAGPASIPLPAMGWGRVRSTGRVEMRQGLSPAIEPGGDVDRSDERLSTSTSGNAPPARL